jgi:hypothetical protein
MSDDEERIGIVIDITTKLPTLANDDGDGPLLISERTNLCYHMRHQAIIDTNGRTLRCGECDAELDPYDYIGFLARDGDHLVAARSKKVRAASERLKELLRQERNAKARIKRLEKRGA